MSEAFDMDRRALLHHALLLTGATVAATAGFSPAALAKAAARPTRFLSAAPFATLVAVADTMIPVTDTPGAVAAKVPETLDAMLRNWAAPATRTLIVDGLGRIDAAARTQQGKPFAALSPDQRKAVLLAHDKAALAPAPLPPGAKDGFLTRVVGVADQGYYRLKDLVISLYYASEIGLTQELIYEHVPGQWVPSLKITPGMRPFAGPGPL